MASGDDMPPVTPDRRKSAPTLVWIMLGAVLVLAFVVVIAFVFEAPPSLKTASPFGPAQRSPAPAQQVAPSTPTPSQDPSKVH
jgi:hypothetical protein